MLRLTPFTLLAAVFCFPAARAQSLAPCDLGKITERVQPEYPLALRSSRQFVQGTVVVHASFGPDGRNTGSKAISGPRDLQFDAAAYVAGWRVQPAPEVRECVVTLNYVFDGSQGACNKRQDVHARVERLDAQNVTIKLSCDLW